MLTWRDSESVPRVFSLLQSYADGVYKYELWDCDRFTSMSLGLNLQSTVENNSDYILTQKVSQFWSKFSSIIFLVKTRLIRLRSGRGNTPTRLKKLTVN